MKFLAHIIVLFTLFIPVSVFAQTDLGGFGIDNYEVDMYLHADRKIDVLESLDVNFYEQRHGIFRTIPIQYQSDIGLNYKLDLDNIQVTDGVNPYTTSIYKQGYDQVIRIGDADRYVDGPVHYEIGYTAQDGIRFFDSGSEFYWNVIGNNWNTTIHKAVGRVHIPEEASFQPSEDIVCFTGLAGSQMHNCTIEYEDNLLTVSSPVPLGPGEGLTVAVRFDSGFSKPSTSEILWKLINDNVGIPLGLVVAFVFLYFWFKHGKEIDLGKPLIARYQAPDNLSPGELGYVFKEAYANQFLSADIVDMAVKGYLRIEEEEEKKFFGKVKEYTLVKASAKSKEKLSAHQKILYDAIFDGRERVVVSDLVNKFYKDAAKVSKKVEEDILAKKWFYANPGLAKVAMVIPSILLFGFSLFMIGTRNDFFVGFFIAGIVGFVCGLFMSKKTREGAEVYHHILGLREYIYTAERYRVKFQEDKNIFEQVLPYAMVFGLADKWAKAFDGILDEPPQWYSGKNGPFVPAVFASSLDNFSKSSVSAFTSQPGSSSSSGFGGGGFSGGGFSGGGGGSW